MSATIEEIASALDGRKRGAGYECKCPAHDDGRASLTVSNGEKGVVVHCHAGCEQDDVIAALRSRGLWTGSRKPERQIVATYDYRDQHGALVSQAVRYLPKDFRQRKPDGAGGWIWKMEGVPRLPYRLPEVLDAIAAGEPVCIVEGEKDADNLWKIGIAATCNAGGAGKWQVAHARWLKEAKVIILPDNDDPGRAHAQQVAQSLAGIACVGRVVELPDLPPKGDVSDWLAAGGTRQQFEALVLEAPRLDLPPLDIGPATPREPWMVPPSLRKDGEHVPDGAALLDAVQAFISRHVAYPSPHAQVAHALWIAHTHLMDVWESTPRIAFLSPEPGSGKTRALEITEALVPRPIEAVNTSSAYLFRKVSDPDGAPTLLYDEIDTLFGPRAKENEDIRGMLNAGHRRGAVAGRCVVRGKTVETEELPAYCAVALAGLGNLPDTILTRAVVIRMRRRAPGETVEPYRHKLHAPTGNILRDQLTAWADSVRAGINTTPIMPAGIADRDADVWEALLAVADAAGGTWPERSRIAAVALVALSKAGNPSLGVRLLDDLRKVLGSKEAMHTEDILKALTGMEEAPWGDLKGKALDSRKLSRYLKQYDVSSKDVRVGTVVKKGYTASDLFDPWSRYLPRVADVAHVAVPDDGRGSAGPAGVERETALGHSPYRSATSATTATEKHQSAGEAL